MEDLISKWGLTVICIIVMLAWSLGRDFPEFKRSVKENPFGDYQQPNTASILGVLGTFIGIAVGLYNFNPAPEAMHNSVINLLGGMTTAFITPILGWEFLFALNFIKQTSRKNFQEIILSNLNQLSPT